MRHHTVAEELLTQAVKALRELAELKAPKLSSGLRQNTEEWRTADELEAIMAHGLYWGSTVLIDDLRLCNGSFGWPRLDEVRSLVDECWLREEADDIMLLTPR